MTLLENINQQTESFKKSFLANYKISVIKELDLILETYKLETYYSQIAKEFGVYKAENEKKIYRKQILISNILYANRNGKIEDLISEEVENAKKSFEAKQEKLSFRLLKKGLSNDFKVSVYSSYPNLEGNITDSNGKTISFYTIVAEGAVQRPHYRYLIK